ncbi:MAG TPA: methyltransferase domain-containing protein [Candidatus Moranbacteria bacterium]|nr:methyltransferase domain-containing protein [Candidatus Moranbacteria bacterium]
MPNNMAAQKEENNKEAKKKDLPFGVKFINPEKVIEEMGVRSGMKIADFGCGTGYFSFPLAKKVGNQGMVYAFDILPSKLEAVESQAKLQGFINLVVKRANLELENGSKLGRESVDWVILVNILYQNSDEGKNKIIEEAKRVVKEKGNILIIEWNDLDSSVGPERKLRISKEKMVELANKNGLGIFKEIEISNFHYGLILVKYK